LEELMLISKKYNFVFIHSRKTSGSSFYVEMNKYLSEKCIQIGGWDDCLNMGGELSKFALRQLLSYRGMAKIMPKLANQDTLILLLIGASAPWSMI
jgi:hypothetical protein